MYRGGLWPEVGIAELRRELMYWLTRVQHGDEVIVTDRGTPVARLTGIAASRQVERLTAQGLITAPRRPRPSAAFRVRGEGSASGFVVAERASRRR